MTDLLAKAFAEAAKLPEAEQDALAAWVLQERASDAGHKPGPTQLTLAPAGR